MNPTAPNEELSRFLASAFSGPELRQFFAQFPDPLHTALPGPSVPLDEVIFEAVSLLERRGLLASQAFWSLLEAARPHRKGDLNKVRRYVNPTGDEASTPEIWTEVESARPNQSRASFAVHWVAIGPRGAALTRAAIRVDVSNPEAAIDFADGLRIEAEYGTGTLLFRIKGNPLTSLRGAIVRIWDGTRATTRRLLAWTTDQNGEGDVIYLEHMIALV